MERFEKWIAESDANNPDDFIAQFEHEALLRRTITYHIQKDLYDLALSLGETPSQAVTKIDLLFSTFAADWANYGFVGNPAITAAIQNDVTIPWLDTIAQGDTIRQHLINRLS